MMCAPRGFVCRFRLALTSLSIAGALLILASPLRAQEAPTWVAGQKKEDAPVSAVHVFVTTHEDGVLLTVAQPGKHYAVVSCYRQCSFWGMPGTYALWATSPELDYETTLHVGKRAAFRVSSGQPGTRTAGLIAGVVGPIVMLGGAVLGLNHALAHQCNESACPPGKDYPAPGVMLIGGLVATLAGWAVYSASGPRVDPVDENAIQALPRPAPRVQLGVLSLSHRGWGMALSTVF